MTTQTLPDSSHSRPVRILTRGLCLIVAATAFAATAALADPAGSGPIVNAVGWIRDTLLGNVATAIAVIAVAMVGFMMLTGRMNWKMGATVILGVFILFGAATIVAGIQSSVGR